MIAGFTLLCIVSAVSVAACDQPAAEYNKLRALHVVALQDGWTKSMHLEQLRIRDCFRIAAALPLLATKLEEINSEELKALRGKDDPASVVAYAASPNDRSRFALKIATAFMLAAVYDKTDEQGKAKARLALFNSFTPTTLDGGTRGMLVWAVASIGPDSVPMMLGSALDKREYIRCAMQDGLDVIREHQSLTDAVPKPPELDCKAAQKTQETRLKQWKSWWEAYGSKQEFPKMPAFFEAGPEPPKP